MNFSRRLLSGILLFALMLVPKLVFAKDLASRLGVGYRNSLVTFDLPSMAVFYSPNPDLAVLGSLGVDTQDENSKFALLGGVRRIIFKEESMNFFMGTTIAMINSEVATKKESGFELAGLIGGEFFLHGLENLGFQFETGVGITTVGKTRFRTLGGSFLSAGMAFYF